MATYVHPLLHTELVPAIDAPPPSTVPPIGGSPRVRWGGEGRDAQLDLGRFRGAPRRRGLGALAEAEEPPAVEEASPSPERGRARDVARQRLRPREGA